jgi:hypothetical protein
MLIFQVDMLSLKIVNLVSLYPLNELVFKIIKLGQHQKPTIYGQNFKKK